MNCPFCKSENLKVHQKNGHAYSTMYCCLGCNRFFSERRFTGYSGLKLPPEKITQIVNCLVEGISMRATARQVNVEKKTVLRVMLHAAALCRRVMDARLRNLSLRYLQADELWRFVGKKAENVTPEEKNNGRHVGDTWVFLVTDSMTKLVPSFMVGNWDLASAELLMADLASRLPTRPQITSDGLGLISGGWSRRSGLTWTMRCSLRAMRSGTGVWNSLERYQGRCLGVLIPGTSRPATRSGTT